MTNRKTKISSLALGFARERAGVGGLICQAAPPLTPSPSPRCTGERGARITLGSLQKLRKVIASLLIASAIVLSLTAVSIAHEGHEHTTNGEPSSSRAWTYRGTGAHLHGSFVSSLDGKVLVRRDDGKVLSIVINELVETDQKWIDWRVAEIRNLNEQKNSRVILVQAPAAKSTHSPANIVDTFEPFAKLNAIKYREGNLYFYVESNGMPDHQMMVGITAWQQQVPIPQSYFGNNAWQIPLFPVVAKNPLSAKSHFFRGAIALAANGVPIFNPIKNDGRTDTLLAGELDEFGGHCGRGDDYHYHIAPTHLEKIVGEGNPLAYALDGYPIYGYTEPDGSMAKGLDSFNGHETPGLGYHYHATKDYPYLNGGFHGEVVERDGQVDPQPRASSVREALPPMRGAKIVGFENTKPDNYKLTYDIAGKKGTVSYTLNKDGSADFTFVEPNGQTRSEKYGLGRRGGGGKGPPKPNGDRPPRSEPRTAEIQGRTEPVIAAIRPDTKEFVVTSPAFEANGMLPIEYTCDGASASPPVEWKVGPEGTESYALSLWHTAPDQEKSYWLVYNIPANVLKLEKNEKNVGKVGLNGKKRPEYDPMCSKGPGVKTYHITVYALSQELKLTPSEANRSSLLSAIKDLTLAESTLDFQYERKQR